MKTCTIFAAAVVSAWATAAFAQNMQGHDNGQGGAGARGAGMLSGTTSLEENHITRRSGSFTTENMPTRFPISTRRSRSGEQRQCPEL